jgi:hypothetical protein
MNRASMPAINDKTVATGAKPRSVDWLINRNALRHARGAVTVLTKCVYWATRTRPGQSAGYRGWPANGRFAGFSTAYGWISAL